MYAIKQKCRPKHQVLILKCYPRLPRNSSAAEIKPNGSELSYLLYYASSRRSKLTKVGTFLEKRTATDLYKLRTASIQITLQILTAFLNNPGIGGAGPQGFGLFAPYVLRILREILKQANETILVEQAVPTWEAFCRHQDHVALSADLEYRSLYAEVVRLWADYATKDFSGGKRAPVRGRMRASVQDTVKLRTAGLEALKCIADSDALNTEAGRQLDVILPVLLQNLYGEEAELEILLRLQNESEVQEKEKNQKGGRPSMATARSTFDNGDVRAAEGTTAEADRLADEETSVLALQCLKSIFALENRQQTRTATNCLLRFVTSQKPRTPVTSTEKPRNAHQTKYAWAIKLFETICNWTAVQDRFVALFTAVELLVRSPIVENELDRQLLLAQIISHVLGSKINLIGLSVMDILLGLLQHVLLILQLGTTGTTLPAQVHITSSDEDLKARPSNEKSNNLIMEVVKTPSPNRVLLLQELRQCIANLAVHVYYTDQISDMVSAILLRLKPSPAAIHNPSITASAIEDPSSAAAEVASQASLRERPNTDGFFSFDTAREVALNAVKDVILTANSAHSDSSYVADNRNTVPVSVWEGTQWLLRDSCADVRQAYVSALCIWLQLELRKSNLRLEEDRTAERKRRTGNGEIASRAASTASARHAVVKKGRSTFMQLLHLAVYENAIQHVDTAEGEADILLLHLLLTASSQSLGLNAVRFSLPMMFRLQDDVQSDFGDDRRAQVRLGSLFYGYLWALCEHFDLENSAVAREIFTEIARRRDLKMWLAGMQMPPVPVNKIPSALSEPSVQAAKVANATAGVHPFNQRAALIEALQTAYLESITTPPQSPPASPPRSFSLPALNYDFATPLSRVSTGGDKKLPRQTVEELSAPWSRDALLATLAATAPKSSSLSGSARIGSGSRSPLPGATAAGGPQNPGTAVLHNNNLLKGDHRHLLAAVNPWPLTRTKSREASPRTSGNLDPERRPSYAPSAASAQAQYRKRSQSRKAAARAASRSPGSLNDGRRPSEATSFGRRAGSGGESSMGGASRVEELKRVLASGGSTAIESHSARGRSSYDDADDTGSESLVDVDDSFNTYGYEDDNPVSDLRDEHIASADMASCTPRANEADEVEETEEFGTPPTSRFEDSKQLGHFAPQAEQPRTESAGTPQQKTYHLTGEASDKDVLDAAFADSSSVPVDATSSLQARGDAPMLRLNSTDLPSDGRGQGASVQEPASAPPAPIGGKGQGDVSPRQNTVARPRTAVSGSSRAANGTLGKGTGSARAGLDDLLRDIDIGGGERGSGGRGSDAVGSGVIGGSSGKGRNGRPNTSQGVGLGIRRPPY